MTESLWAVMSNTDLTEGRGRAFVKHLCRIRATAIRLGKGEYVMGTDCPISEVKVVLVDGKPMISLWNAPIQEPLKADLSEQKRIDAVEVAIAKAKAAGLSDEDIAAIRLTS